MVRHRVAKPGVAQRSGFKSLGPSRYVTRALHQSVLSAVLRRGFLFLVWPCVITPSVPSTVGFFVYGDLGFVLQGHSYLVQTEQQAGAGERINRKLGGKTVRGRNCAALQIDGQLESTGLGTRHKVTSL